MEKDAVISPCGLYRYELTRTWDNSLPRLYWVMLNPSTADAYNDDPTIRRVIGFSKQEGFGSAAVVNLYALRTPSPKVLMTVIKKGGIDAAIGEENLSYLEKVADSGDVVVGAWGNHGAYGNRGNTVKAMFPSIQALKVGKTGQPGHPLYLKGDLRLKLFQ